MKFSFRNVLVAGFAASFVALLGTAGLRLTAYLPGTGIALTIEERAPAMVVRGKDLIVTIKITNTDPAIDAYNVWGSLTMNANPGIYPDPATLDDCPLVPGDPSVRIYKCSVGGAAHNWGYYTKTLVFHMNTKAQAGTYINTYAYGHADNARSDVFTTLDPQGTTRIGLPTDTVPTTGLAISETPSTLTPRPGDQVTYTVTAKATSTGVLASNMWVSFAADNKAVLLTRDSGCVVVASNDPTKNLLLCPSQVSYRAGKPLTYSFPFLIPSNTPCNTVLRSYALVYADNGSPNYALTDLQQQTPVTVTCPPPNHTDLSVSVLSRPSFPVSEGTGSYVVQVNNAGPGSPKKVQLLSILTSMKGNATLVGFASSRKDIPVNCTGSGCTFPLNATDSITLTLTYRMPKSTICPSTPVNDYMVVGSELVEDNQANNRANGSVPLACTPNADLLVGYVFPPSSLVPEGSGSYTVTVQNIGPSDAKLVKLRSVVTVASGSLSLRSVSSSRPDITPICTADGICTFPLKANNSVSLTLNYTMPKNQVCPSIPVTYLMSVASELPDLNLTNNQKTGSSTLSCTPPPIADLSVQTTSRPPTIHSGNTVTYVVNVRNAGPAEAKKVVLHAGLQTNAGPVTLQSVTTSLLASTPTCTADGTCTFPLAASGSVTFGLTYKLPKNTICPSTPVTDQMSVESELTDPNPANNKDAGGSVSMSCEAPTADVSVATLSRPASLSSEGTGSYVVQVNNAGPSDAKRVQLLAGFRNNAGNVNLVNFSSSRNDIPVNCSTSGCTFPLNASGSVTLTLTYRMPKSTICPSSLVYDSMVVMSELADPNPANNRDAGGSVPLTCTPGADVSIAAVYRPSSFALNGSGAYTVLVYNAGPSDAKKVTFNASVTIMSGALALQSASSSRRDITPSCTSTGTCTFPLNANGYVYLTLTYRVPPLVCPAIPLVRDAMSVTSELPDANPANNKAIPGTTPISCAAGTTRGNLFVSQDTTPLRPHQCLGGAECDTALRLNFRADTENVDVTELHFTASGATTSVDHLDLYTDSGTFVGSAFSSQCSTGASNASTYCVLLQGKPLVVGNGRDVKLLVKPFLRADTSGALSGQKFQIALPGTAIVNETNGAGAVHAYGETSKSYLIANNGNWTEDGEIFIGLTQPAPFNADIVGKTNVSVLGKIANIMNADPDPNGTNVPTGVAGIGQFTITAAANNNTTNGLNKVTLSGVMLNVNATNVTLDTTSFKFYNKANPNVTEACMPMTTGGMVLTGTASGSFVVYCALGRAMAPNNPNVVIDQGTSQTFVLQATVTNPKVSAIQVSLLQVSLQSFNDIAKTVFGLSGSHFQWIDQDTAPIGTGTTTSSVFDWMEYPDSIVKSTLYQS